MRKCYMYHQIFYCISLSGTIIKVRSLYIQGKKYIREICTKPLKCHRIIWDTEHLILGMGGSRNRNGMWVSFKRISWCILFLKCIFNSDRRNKWVRALSENGDGASGFVCLYVDIHRWRKGGRLRIHPGIVQKY